MAVAEGGISTSTTTINLGLPKLLIDSIISRTHMRGMRSVRSTINCKLLMLTYLHAKSTAIKMISSLREADEDRELNRLDMQIGDLM